MCSCFTDGVDRVVYLINGQQPGRLVEADEGDDLEIFVKNELTVETTVHWHGQYIQQQPPEFPNFALCEILAQNQIVNPGNRHPAARNAPNGWSTWSHAG